MSTKFSPKTGIFSDVHTLSDRYKASEARLRSMARQYARSKPNSNESFDMLSSFKYLSSDDRQKLNVRIVQEEKILDSPVV